MSLRCLLLMLASHSFAHKHREALPLAILAGKFHDVFRVFATPELSVLLGLMHDDLPITDRSSLSRHEPDFADAALSHTRCSASGPVCEGHGGDSVDGGSSRNRDL